nr:hypothetical protein [uncultured Roseococcus sp.]
MFNAETEFMLKVSNLPSPTSHRFSAAIWEDLHKKFGKTQSDANLLYTANWIANQSKFLRSEKARVIPKISGKMTALLAIAAANREFFAANIQISKKINARNEEGLFLLDYIVSQPLSGTMNGMKVSPATVTEVSIDSTESVLFDAYSLSENDDIDKVLIQEKK